MKPATKKALLESIEHWKENENVERIEDAKVGPKHCALCARFLKEGCTKFDEMKEKTITEYCPVKLSTGKLFCYESPYILAEELYNKEDLQGFKLIAKKEREFLESLLPDEK